MLVKAFVRIVLTLVVTLLDTLRDKMPTFCFLLYICDIAVLEEGKQLLALTQEFLCKRR